MNVCVIPARGGSKRIPRKNIKDFCGKPMIAWSIETALNSECFEEVIVSTDDAEIADIALSYGAKVPFIRPSHLSDDYSTTTDVVKHAIQEIIKYHTQVEYICCLYATAPFVKSEFLEKAIQSLQESQSDFALAVTTFDFPIQRALFLDENNCLRANDPKLFMQRSQDLIPYYHDAGQFLCGNKNAWLESSPFLLKKIVPIHIPSYLVQDIDTIDDWKKAEFMHRAMNEIN